MKTRVCIFLFRFRPIDNFEMSHTGPLNHLIFHSLPVSSLFSVVFVSVSSSLTFGHLSLTLCVSTRKTTCTRRPCRLWSTPSPAPRHTISKSGRPPRPPTATSARVCCGASRGRACAVPSAGSKCTRSAKSCWTPTACRVSHRPQNYLEANHYLCCGLFSFRLTNELLRSQRGRLNCQTHVCDISVSFYQKLLSLVIWQLWNDN